MRWLLAVLAMLAALGPARGEDLVVALSQEQVAISSNFSGTQIVLFGAIERDAQTVPRPAGYDVVIVVRGPDQDIVARRKERVLGIWVNRTAREYSNVPSFYAVLANRDLTEIASPTTLRHIELGLENIALSTPDAPGAEEHPDESDFAEGFLRLKERQALYYENFAAVEPLSRSLFKAEVPMPANVPVGEFTAEVYLFASGALLAVQSASIMIDKTGFEQFVFDLAHNWPAVYGLAAILMALAIGWGASILFRRD